MPNKVITPEKEQYIKEHYMEMSRRDLAKELGVSRSAVDSYMKRTGLKVPREVWKKWMCDKQRKPFSPMEDEYIHRHIPNRSIKKIAKELKRDQTYVSKRAHELGYSELIQEKAMKSRFQKGHETFNKGKNMKDYLDPDTIEKIKKSQFQKGHEPHNTTYDGHVSLRHDSKTGIPYFHIRVRKGHFEHLHRYIWEKENGPVPEGKIVVFKNGDTLDVRIDNLQVISREENMLRNSKHNIPREVIPSMAMISQIKNKIKQYEEQINGPK